MSITRKCHNMCRSRGGDRGSGSPPPLKNHKNLGFLSNTGRDPLKNYKATKPVFNVGPTFKWCFAGKPMMARLLYWYLDPSLPHQLKKKNHQSWNPSGKTFWIRACTITHHRPTHSTVRKRQRTITAKLKDKPDPLEIQMNRYT